MVSYALNINALFKNQNFRKLLLTNLGVGISLLSGAALVKTSFAENKKKTRLFSWGSGQYFQTGQGHNRNIDRPERISFFDDIQIKSIDSNGQQSVVLSENGEIFTFGRGEDCRLGHGSEENEMSPRLVRAFKGLKMVAASCGEKHMAAVDENGKLWVWGRGNKGQLGHEFGEAPTKIEGLPEIKSVSCGKEHTLALTGDGKVYSTGYGRAGILGHGDRQNLKEFRQIKALDAHEVVQVAAAQDFSLFLTNKGEVLSCGNSDFGQTGRGQKNRYFLTPEVLPFFKGIKVEKIAAKYYHAAAITADSRLFTWGFNKYGQLGVGDTFERHLPCEVPLKLVERDLQLLDVDCGAWHTGVVAANSDKKQLFLFGNGRYGQLGNGDQLESVAAFRTNPVRITESFDGCSVERVALGSDHSLCQCVENK